MCVDRIYGIYAAPISMALKCKCIFQLAFRVGAARGQDLASEVNK